MLTALLTSVAVGTVLGVILAAVSGPLASRLFESRGHGSLLVVVAATLPVGAAAQLTREAMRLKFRAWHYTDLGGHRRRGGRRGEPGGGAAAPQRRHRPVRRHARRKRGRGDLRVLGHAWLLRPRGIARGTAQHARLRAASDPAGPVDMGARVRRPVLARGSQQSPEVGEYAVANRLAGVILFLVTAFGTAYSPFIFRSTRRIPRPSAGFARERSNLLTLGLLAVSGGLGAVRPRADPGDRARHFTPRISRSACWRSGLPSTG